MTDRTVSHTIFLLIDVRTCACNTTYTCPNPRLSLRTVRYDNQGFLRSYMTPWTDSIPPEIPRAKHYVHSCLDSCPACFHESNGTQTRLPEGEPLAAVPPARVLAPTPTALSDF